jgi:hypothetical protein
MPGRLRRGDPALGDLGAGLLPQPGRDPAPRRQARHPLGERLARAGQVGALAPHLDPVRDRRAARARRRGRVIGDRPYLHRAVRPLPGVSDLQALHAEQHGRRILEHDARGFLSRILW